MNQPVRISDAVSCPACLNRMRSGAEPESSPKQPNQQAAPADADVADVLEDVADLEAAFPKTYIPKDISWEIIFKLHPKEAFALYRLNRSRIVELRRVVRFLESKLSAANRTVVEYNAAIRHDQEVKDRQEKEIKTLEREAALTKGQHTVCAKCGLDKPTPYRRDDLGGYVCLTCVETYLNETLDKLDNCHQDLGRAKLPTPSDPMKPKPPLPNTSLLLRQSQAVLDKFKANGDCLQALDSITYNLVMTIEAIVKYLEA
jgi:hypothetical protein